MDYPSRARLAAGAGAALAVASVPLPYLRAGGDPVVLPLPVGDVGADAVVAAVVLAGAAVSLVDHTRGEQLLGAVTGGLAAAVAVGWVAGAAGAGGPFGRLTAGPGLAVAMVGWGVVEVADLLDPGRSHPRGSRWAAVGAVAGCVAGTVGFLLVDGGVRLVPGALGVAAWLYAVRWELAATRSSPLARETPKQCGTNQFGQDPSALSVWTVARVAGAGLLAAAAVAMGVAGVYGLTAPAVGSPLVASVVPAVAVLSSVAYLAVRETRQVVAGDRTTPGARDAANALAVAAGAPVTRWLAVEAGLGVVVASALVGLVAGLALPEYGVPVYCGSFVGMAGTEVLGSYAAVAAAGLAAGAVFVLAAGLFDGFGGKLGTTAFVGCGAVVLATGSAPAAPAPIPPLETATLLVGSAGAAAVATFVASVRLGHGPVVGSGVVGLTAGLVAPPLLGAGEAVAAVAFCASFAGMARPDRLPDERVMLGTGILCGVLFVAVTPYFGGFGGKLGTVAFTACLGARAVLAAVDSLPSGVTSVRPG
jgi:hypothetical protein